MIVKAHTKNQRKAFHWTYFIGLGLLIPLWILTNKDTSSIATSDAYVLCNADFIKDEKFVTQTTLASGVNTQSAEKSYSGKYSSKVGSTNKYGMTVTVPVVNLNERFIVSIRRWTLFPSKSALNVSGNTGSGFSKQTSTASFKDDDGWELLTLEFNLPEDRSVDTLTIFPYSIYQEDDAYFDDLRLETISLDSLTAAPPTKLHFYLDNKAVDKLEQKREEAVQRGVLKSVDEDWVKAKLIVANEKSPIEVKLRLKGDWTDHLKGDYWSYRVKMPTNRSWNRLQTFSLQDPVTRHYLHEWLYHKALEGEDIITPRYGFVLLSQNTKKPTYYAYEEHFEKQIAEYKERREGVIVKFSEDHFWDKLLRDSRKDSDGGSRNPLATAEVLPFKEGKTTANPKLKEQFNHANKLMNAFRNQTAPVSEIFDVERMAKYLAITDIFDAGHGTAWHNLRFYYNPVLRKLEPIGFDGYTETGAMKNYNGLFFGEYKSSDSDFRGDALFRHLFQDSIFNARYTKALLKYSNANFLTVLLKKYNKDIYNYEKNIRTYIKDDYRFNLTDLRNRVRKIRNDIIPYSQNSLKVYRELDEKGIPTFWATNHHSLPLEVFGSSTSAKGNIISTQATFIKSNREWSPNSYTQVKLPENARQACFRLPGLDSTFYTQIHNWQRPSSQLKVLYSSHAQPKVPLPTNSFQIKDKIITIKSGRHQVLTPVIIPKGFTLVVEAGTTVDFTEKSYLLSYGPVHFKGSKDAPIQFTSSDNSSQGLTVIQASKTSTLSFTSFEHFNTLEENEWQLTGAVTFYESNVDFNTVTIAHNQCEDALNLVRSNFKIRGLNINHTFADGFDGDFCRGTLEESYLFKTGNDGLDFSGSWVTVTNVKLDQIGDKGISAGEEAHLTISDVSISNAQIGVASKDLSEVSVKNTSLTNCPQGFAAYRKKPEFGGGKIRVESYRSSNVKRLTNTDSESAIILPQ